MAAPPSYKDTENILTRLPWWRRYTRWRQTSLEEAKAAEKALLAPCKSDLDIKDVRVGPRTEDTMHTIVAGDEKAPTLVVFSGYGAGSGFYFRNIDTIAKQFRVYFVDFLGTGLSGRPHWEARNRVEAENFFLDAFRKWKEELGIGKMILCGHSLGGYLAATYALQSPEDIEHLVLLCTAGMSSPPKNQPMPEWAKNPLTFRGMLYRGGLLAWDKDITPGSLIRTLGPYGPKWAAGYVNRRFHTGERLTEEQISAFGQYIYHITAQKGSGEYALRHLLAPFAHARHPLEGRLHELKVPCSLIYGESDWMRPENGRRVFDDIEQRRGKLTDADLQFDVVPGAGHYVYLEQPDIFFQRFLRQLHPYLASRGPKSAKLATDSLKEADMAAEVAEKELRDE